MMGRPPLGPAIVDELDLPEDQRKRLRPIIDVIAGRKTVEEACAALAVGRAQFYQLQRRALLGMAEAVAPKPPGRTPAPPPSAAERENRRLREELRDLKLERHAAEIRAEIAETMPHLLRKSGQKKRRRAW
jgi:hypothetical protein